jgi:hypothetical protein
MGGVMAGGVAPADTFAVVVDGQDGWHHVTSRPTDR